MSIFTTDNHENLYKRNTKVLYFFFNNIELTDNYSQEINCTEQVIYFIL